MVHSFGEVGINLLPIFQFIDVGYVFGHFQFWAGQIKDLTLNRSDDLPVTEEGATVGVTFKFQLMDLIGMAHLRGFQGQVAFGAVWVSCFSIGLRQAYGLQ